LPRTGLYQLVSSEHLDGKPAERSYDDRDGEDGKDCPSAREDILLSQESHPGDTELCEAEIHHGDTGDVNGRYEVRRQSSNALVIVCGRHDNPTTFRAA
jgi:hypothetical protein